MKINYVENNKKNLGFLNQRHFYYCADSLIIFTEKKQYDCLTGGFYNNFYVPEAQFMVV
jgi:hypothetical protein